MEQLGKRMGEPANEGSSWNPHPRDGCGKAVNGPHLSQQ